MFAACGDNKSPCDYTETDDADNGTTAEMTGLTVGSPATHVCGTFTGDPYDATLASADDDRYRVTVADNSPILVDVWVDDGLSALKGVTVRIFDMSGTLVGQATPAFSDHAAFTIALQPGDYDFLVSADATGMLAGDPISYRVRFETMPGCDESTGDANYKESGAANGTVDVDFSKDPSFTMDSSSAPEASGLSFDPGDNKSITGSLDTADAGVDQYADRDTYEITTGDDTNELAIRLTWDGNTDVDYLVFEADTMLPIIASNASSSMGPELQMFAVKPKTTYWVWVGAVSGGSVANYRATVCGWRFFY